jgi:cytoplasmic iron level regulating protein YaaA (DUF328/UPF0246 family)
MLILLSPAKTLDFESEPATDAHSEPRFVADSKRLVALLKKRSPADIASLMGLSDKLAELNHRRYAEWTPRFDPGEARQAVLAFRGDVYTGLQADRWREKDFAWAQDHLRILSGLHGVLRPLDLIRPYRLEMGTKLPNPRGDDLYAFWRETVTAALREDLEAMPTPITVNLASNEYFGAVDASVLPGRLVTPWFEDLKNDRYKVISFYAKKARGLMADWIVRHRVRSVGKLKDFDVAGYAFDADATAAAPEGRLVFRRDEPR